MKERFYWNRHKISALIFLLLAMSFSSLAQHRFQVWTDFNARFKLKNKFQLNVEPGYRIEPEIKKQIAYFRSALRYSPTTLFSMDLGVANFNTWRPDVFSSYELRVFEYAFLNWPKIGGFDFKLRLGLEQRWFRFPDLGGDQFVHRARARLGVKSPNFAFWEGVSKLYFTGNFEVLRDVNEEIIEGLVNEDRLMLGLGFNNMNRWRIELHYQYMFLIDRAVGEFIPDVDLVRLRVFYTPGPKP